MPRAPKKCPHPQCEARITGRTYCPAHTPTWVGTTRRERLPQDWQARRAAVQARAHGRCEATVHDPACDGVGTDCDHVIQGDDHALTNLQWLSTPCHKAKTARESRQRNRSRFQRR